jgi:hypothetical protein
LKTLLVASLLLQMLLQRQATQIVIDATRSQDVMECDGKTRHQRYHVGMLYGKPCYNRAPFFAGS